MKTNDIEKLILEKYPDAIIRNKFFLFDEALNDFPLDVDDTLVKLCELPNNNLIFELMRYLYSYGTLVVEKEILKYIIKNDINFFNRTDEDLSYDDINKFFGVSNLLTEYDSLYKKQEFTYEYLEKVFHEYLENNEGKNFIEYDLSFYNLIIILQKLYQDKEVKMDEISDIIKELFTLFQKKTIKDLGNYDNFYDHYIQECIGMIVLGDISINRLYESLNNYDSLKNLFISGKFDCGKIFSSNQIPFEVVEAIKKKNINNFSNMLINYDEDEIKKRYTKEDLVGILIKMVSLLGVNHVNNILTHLPDDYFCVIKLLNCFKDINLSDTKVIDKKIIYNDEFIKFFMGDNLSEKNSLLNLIYYNYDITLGEHLEELYYYWDELDERYKNQDLLTRLSFLEESFQNSDVFLESDEYLLEGDILNSCIDYERFQKLSKLELVQSIRNTYKEMKHNFQKTIPYVSGEHKGYNYETLKANDPKLFMCGPKTDCCFGIGCDAESFVNYCALNKNGRVVAITDKRNQLVAMIPMVRNGNLILCNSIESKFKRNFKFMETMFEILENISEQFMNISRKVETEEQRIKIILIGNYKNEIEKFHKYSKINYVEIKDECLSPYDDKDLDIYANMGGYEWENYCIKRDEELKLWTLNSFEPTYLYDDPRESVLELEDFQIQEKDKKRVQSIYYEKNKNILDFINIEKIIYNDDWFISVDKNYTIISEIVGKDPRAVEERMEYLELMKEYYSSFEEDGYLVSRRKH